MNTPIVAILAMEAQWPTLWRDQGHAARMPYGPCGARLALGGIVAEAGATIGETPDE